MIGASSLPIVDHQQVDEYRLIRPLGRADGTTFLAHDRLLDRAVVLSFLAHPASGSDARLAGARALARVTHPNLCPLHRVRDAGRHPYIVSAYARGHSLSEIATPLSDRRVLDLGRALAGALATLHLAGVAHGDVRKERVVLSDEGDPLLFGFARARAPADEPARRKDVEALVMLLESLADTGLSVKLAAFVDERRGAPNADELRAALEALSNPPASHETLAENPYRGLRAFEAEHAATFFGRRRETAELLTRLRGQPLLLIAGRSGSGKSSLVRAGLVPAITGGRLGERATWDVITMTPGARPLETLATRLAGVFGGEVAKLSETLRRTPGLAGRMARRRADRGFLLVVDQLEESMTLSDSAERHAFADALARFGMLAPGVRVIMTLRSDFLERLGELGALARDLLRTTYVLPAMEREGLREAITGPARARGFAFETPAMVDALLTEVSGIAEALPLLSFALTELWSERNQARKVIPAAALERLGGAAAALARHGELVMAALQPEERSQARRLLLTLAKAAETGARRSEAELVENGGQTARSALAALARGRLVVAGETYAIAHEALARAWPRLRSWLDEASDARAAAARLATAAGSWDRLGRNAEALWSARQLRDLEVAGALDGSSREAQEFIAASWAAVRSARRRRAARRIGVPLVVGAIAASSWMVAALRHRAAVARAVDEARALDAVANATARAAESLRTKAFALFEQDDPGPAEALWKQTLAREDDVDTQRRDVSAALDRALALEPRSGAARALYADVTFARILAAERLHHAAVLASLRARLALHDNGSRASRLHEPGRVRAATDPPGAGLTLVRYREDPSGHLIEADAAPLEAGRSHELEPGSYVLHAALADRYPTVYPFVVRRGESLDLRVVLPREEDVPEGMIYVPAGRFEYGSDDDEETRRFFTHQPVHDVELGAFLIARTEVTNGDYIAFLEALPEPERKGRLPGGLRLGTGTGGRFAWKLRDKMLAPEDPYCNGIEPCTDWSVLPVDGVNRMDGEHFAEWLSRSGRVPGARLCTDREWERAARGADNRRYPSGNGDPASADVCALVAYGGDSVRAGPCAVGMHPASRSLFGVDDMSGSEEEWISGSVDVAKPAQGALRGGGWNMPAVYITISNRDLTGTEGRFSPIGLRVCADAK